MSMRIRLEAVATGADGFGWWGEWSTICNEGIFVDDLQQLYGAVPSVEVVCWFLVGKFKAAQLLWVFRARASSDSHSVAVLSLFRNKNTSYKRR